MAEGPVDGIYLITVRPTPPAFTGAPTVPSAVTPMTASVEFHETAVGEELVDTVTRVVRPDDLGCRFIALDAAHAIELRMNPGIEPVPPAA